MRIAILLVLTAAATGCAQAPRLPWMKSASEKVGLDRVFENDYEQLASRQRDRKIVTPMSQDTPFWKRPFGSSHPKVVRTNDPVRLSTQTEVSADVHIEAARLHEQRGDLAAAARGYGRALKADPDNQVALLCFARLYDRNSRFEDAEKLYQRAVAQHPTSGQAANDYGLCLVRRGEVGEGLEQLSRAVELSPQEPRYRNNLAQVLVADGRVDEALQQLSAVHSEAAAHYNVGHWLQSQGNPAALAHFTRAAELDPTLQAAQQMVAQLQRGAVARTASATSPQGSDYSGPLYGEVQRGEMR